MEHPQQDQWGYPSGKQVPQEKEQQIEWINLQGYGQSSRGPTVIIDSFGEV